MLLDLVVTQGPLECEKTFRRRDQRWQRVRRSAAPCDTGRVIVETGPDVPLVDDPRDALDSIEGDRGHHEHPRPAPTRERATQGLRLGKHLIEQLELAVE
jgi:hypothetical protein